MTRDCGGGSRHDEIPPSNKRPRPRRHGWPRLSHLRWQADFHWRTFWGRFVHGQKKTESLPALPNIPTFVELVGDQGLDFIFDNGQTVERQIPETMSGGVGLFDFDGDGWLDIYAIQGGKFPPRLVRPPSGTASFATAATATLTT